MRKVIRDRLWPTSTCSWPLPPEACRFSARAVLPLVPSYLSFVSGISPREMSEGSADTARVMGNAFAFVFGFSLAFVALGASASLLGRLLIGYQDVVRVAGGVFILVVGVYLTGLFKVATLERYAQFNLRSKPAGYLGSVLVGLTFAVAWIPCVGPYPGRHPDPGRHPRRDQPRRAAAVRLRRRPGPAAAAERPGHEPVSSVSPAPSAPGSPPSTSAPACCSSRSASSSSPTT